LLFAVRRWVVRRWPVESGAPVHRAERAVFWGVGLSAVLFASAKIALVVLVICAGSRYILPAGVFLPSVLGLWILAELRTIGAAVPWGARSAHRAPGNTPARSHA
jgi:hypothetical protein